MVIVFCKLILTILERRTNYMKTDDDSVVSFCCSCSEIECNALLFLCYV